MEVAPSSPCLPGAQGAELGASKRTRLYLAVGMRKTAGSLLKALLLQRLSGRKRRRRHAPSADDDGDDEEAPEAVPLYGPGEGPRPASPEAGGQLKLRDEGVRAASRAQGRSNGQLHGEAGEAHGEAELGASGVSSEDNEEVAGAEEGEEEILMVDFDVFAPEEGDFHGIRALLAAYLDDEAWDVSSLADVVIKGGAHVGSVVKAGDEGYVMGVISCPPLVAKAKGWPGEVRRFIQSRCGNAAAWESIWESLQRLRVGLLLCERVVNLPPQLVPPLFASLFQELRAKAKKEGESRPYSFDAVIVLTRAFKESSSPRRKQKAPSQAAAPLEALEFVRPEDELLQKMATTWFTFPLHSDALASQQEKGFTMVGLFMLVHLSKNVDSFLTHLTEVCGQAPS